MHVKVVCLLPARNAAADLAWWFPAVEPFVDAVVALDDGSTDDTADVLDAHPLVSVLLRNDRREDHAGWDDAANRNRLLAAAAALSPDWLISVDTDERFAPEEAVALRRFIETQARPGHAYGFPRHRMIGDLDHHDGVEDRAYRLFAHRPGHSFPPDRLHGMPVPTSIPRGRWLATDLRLQHLCGLTADSRRARRQKYVEADPTNRWDTDYSYTDAAPKDVRRWVRRRASDPVLLRAHFDWDDPGPDDAFALGPALTVVLLAEPGRLDEVVAASVAVEAQSADADVLVVVRGHQTADDVGRALPTALVIEEDADASPAKLRNTGARAALGDYVVALDAPASFDVAALDEVIAAHDRGCGLVTGDVDNLVPSAPGWAAALGAVHASFARRPLLQTGSFPDVPADEVERTAAVRLSAAGQQAAHVSGIRFGHRSPATTPTAHVEARRSAAAADERSLPALVAAERQRWSDVQRRAAASPEGRAALPRVRRLVHRGAAAALLVRLTLVHRRRRS